MSCCMISHNDVAPAGEEVIHGCPQVPLLYQGRDMVRQRIPRGRHPTYIEMY